MPDEFSDKVAVITGGSRGIGREIAVEFARAGAQTVIVSSSAANLAAASTTIAAAGGPAPRRRRGGPAPARRLPAGVRRREGEIQPLRHSGLLGGRNPRRQFRRPAGRCLARRLCVEIVRLRAHVPAVLADAQGGAGFCRQYRRRRGALARRRFLDRRFGQRGDGQFLQGAVAARQARRRQRQRHPSGRDRDRALLSADRAALEGIRQIGRTAQAEATAKDGLRRLGKAEDVAALALFLCSERARHIQGTAIAVDGGATVGYY